MLTAMRAYGFLFVALVLGAGIPASFAQLVTPAQQTAGDQAKRDALLQPGLAKLKAGDAAGAYAASGPALVAYPADVHVLQVSAQAALLSRQYQPALDLFDRALATHPDQPWPIRLGRMQAESRLGKMDDFDHDLADLRAAKMGNDPALAKSNGFVIDEFEVDGGAVEVIVFPAMASRFHTLYRFYLPKQSKTAPAAQAGVTQNGTPDACKNPNFQPYIDLESDDVDQQIFKKAHPDLAAKGGREFSLDSYPAPCSQGLLRFFDGEPKYEDVRAIILKPKK
jgi:hypothetical protein